MNRIKLRELAITMMYEGNWNPLPEGNNNGTVKNERGYEVCTTNGNENAAEYISHVGPKAILELLDKLEYYEKYDKVIFDIKMKEAEKYNE